MNLRIAINVSTQKKGGGQNVVLNFLNVYLRDKGNSNRAVFIVAKDSCIHKLLLQKCVPEQIIVVSDNPVKRIFQEFFCVSNLLVKMQVDIIYSYFGYGLFRCNIPQIVGSADSNLYYPNIDFWSEYKGVKYLVKRFIDRYRVFGLHRAAGIVYETDILEKKSYEVYRFKGITKTIKPSISIPESNSHFEFPAQFNKKPKGLMLCSWQLNKNIMLVPLIAANLKQKGVPFLFTITAPQDNSDICREFLKLVDEYEVQKYIYISGTVSKDKLRSLYQQTDIVLLLSKLESFSNNIIEAWTFRKPLLVADEEWAHDICHEAADYVNRDDADAISNQIIKLLNDVPYRDLIVEEGSKVLKKYPSIEQRTQQELDFIQFVYDKIH
jgi:glycosyltransferase involved in cell wall biosynthesis